MSCLTGLTKNHIALDSQYLRVPRHRRSISIPISTTAIYESQNPNQTQCLAKQASKEPLQTPTAKTSKRKIHGITH
ncbi:sodium/bile acid cotransporter 7-B/bile acid cotransporter 7-B [Cryptococcus neoformans]|nr:sodium/bile acid cotransporter 7-B/bile acid cotransporter 7-B [Cryptococcus neoformans var. grubii]OXH42411.1 sodium/bile acid cotransporter 7-B/bile acid cotransporter 7-B [Cryptococcus neoformans var. grubii]